MDIDHDLQMNTKLYLVHHRIVTEISSRTFSVPRRKQFSFGFWFITVRKLFGNKKCAWRNIRAQSYKPLEGIVIKDACILVVGILVISCTTFDKCFEVLVYSNEKTFFHLGIFKCWLSLQWSDLGQFENWGISSDISSLVGAYFVKWFIFPICGVQKKCWLIIFPQYFYQAKRSTTFRNILLA